MDAEELLKKIRTIDIQTKGWVDSVFSGAYHSRFKGQGVHFNEVRQYAYGDDVHGHHEPQFLAQFHLSPLA